MFLFVKRAMNQLISFFYLYSIIIESYLQTNYMKLDTYTQIFLLFKVSLLEFMSHDDCSLRKD